MHTKFSNFLSNIVNANYKITIRSALLHKNIAELFMHSVSTVQCKLVCFSGEYFADPVMSWLREWHLWRVPVGYDMEMLPLLHGYLLDMVDTLWLHQVATATPKGLHVWIVYPPSHTLPPSPLLRWPDINAHLKNCPEICPSIIYKVT